MMHAKPCGNKIGPFDCCSVVCGDTFELLPSLPSGCVGAVISDPPFGVGINRMDWDDRVPYEMLADMLRISSGPVLWFGAANRIAEAYKPFTPPPQRMLVWAPKFLLRAAIENNVVHRYCPIYSWRLPNKRSRAADAHVWDVLHTHAERKSQHWWDHACTKPVKLMRKLVGFAPTGGVVLDPFAGSGSTLVAARDAGRHFLGFEIDAAHVEVCNARLAGEVPCDADKHLASVPDATEAAA